MIVLDVAGRERRGLGLGRLGVVILAMTLAMVGSKRHTGFTDTTFVRDGGASGRRRHVEAAVFAGTTSHLAGARSAHGAGDQRGRHRTGLSPSS
jgi:hypothetical protein